MKNKVKVSVALSPDLERILRAQSQEQGVSFSSLVDELLATALRSQRDQVTSDLLGPKLQATIRKEVRAMADRLAGLLVRAALESARGKQLAFQLVVKEFGVDQAREFRDRAWRASVEDLRGPLEGLAEVLRAEDEQEDKAVAGRGTL